MKHTFGGLPRFFFGTSSADAASAVGPGAEDGAGLVLFLLPLGRPRPRLTGGESAGVSSEAMKARKRGELKEQAIIASDRGHGSDWDDGSAILTLSTSGSVGLI